MNKYLIFIKEYIWYLLALIMLLPSVSILRFEIPAFYLFAPIMTLMVFHMSFKSAQNSEDLIFPNIIKQTALIWFAIVVYILVTALILTSSIFSRLVFPTEVMQYMLRAITFIYFFQVAYLGKLKQEIFVKIFLVVLLIAMCIGIAQWIPWPGRVFFIKLYPFRDGQLQLSQLDRNLVNIRMHGFARHATSNSGFSVFSSVFAFAIFSIAKRHRMLSLAVMFFSLINLVASTARSGYITLAFAILLFLVFYLVKNNFSKLSLTVTIITLMSIAFIFIILYKNQNQFVLLIIDRFKRIIETQGGERFNEQPGYFFSIMQPLNFLIGLSKPVINASHISYGVEVEFLNILITYGIIGLLFHYLLIIVVLRYLFRAIKIHALSKSTRALALAAFVSTLSYQIFALAYYFFREINVGYFPWILIGVTIGYVEAEQIKHRADTSIIEEESL